SRIVQYASGDARTVNAKLRCSHQHNQWNALISLKRCDDKGDCPGFKIGSDRLLRRFDIHLQLVV
ncbi:hypothetical protein QUA08_11495, partial [Microcoleus sp. T3B2]|uniref:hypothetical protein n=1 Tax=Microcoleus sp. T3B2 TaxID=3055426 RepID=UPI002FD4F02E